MSSYNAYQKKRNNGLRNRNKAKTVEEMISGASPISFKQPKIEDSTETFFNLTSRFKVKVPTFHQPNESAFESIEQAILARDRLHSPQHPFGIQTDLWTSAQSLCKGGRRMGWSNLLGNIAVGARTTDRLLDAVGEHIAACCGNSHPRDPVLAMLENLRCGKGAANMALGDYAARWEHLFEEILPHMPGSQPTPGNILRKMMFIKTFDSDDIAYVDEKGGVLGLVTYTGDNAVDFF